MELRRAVCHPGSRTSSEVKIDARLPFGCCHGRVCGVLSSQCSDQGNQGGRMTWLQVLPSYNGMMQTLVGVAVLAILANLVEEALRQP